MKKVLIGVVVLLVLGTIVVASIRSGKGEKGTEVYAEPVERRDLAQVVKASGELEPRVKVNISAHVIGKIERLFVEEGDRIERGQPFLQLEREAFLAQRDQWAAQLRSAQTAVRQAEVSLADSRHKLQRAQRLQTEGIFSSEQLEAAQLAETSAELRLQEAREAVSQTRANLTKAQDDLSKTTIFAPLTGRVIVLNAEEGEVVVSGTMNNPASVIGTIADMSEILATVDVDETEIVKVKVGQEAVLKVDALPGKEYHGRVVEVGSSGFNRASQPDVTFFQVKILFSDPDEDLRADMSVRAEIQTAEHGDTLVAPIQAVVEREPLEDQGETRTASTNSPGGGRGEEETVKAVFVIESGKAVQRRVETGLSDETHVELTSGVKAGEQVVTGPYRALRDLKNGDAVTVSKTSEEEDRRAKDEDEDEEER
ncbi:MAG TPA: efflux RND transporter periplasmic adaptor subunit [Thermoanaerobaculia bacterium]|nr:efflux RND transporter periplasmic adaptor subunit [Thermoanaerobaculia bacterium]